eukprot:7286614-Pyramimonas_sp.AAC.1
MSSARVSMQELCNRGASLYSSERWDLSGHLKKCLWREVEFCLNQRAFTSADLAVLASGHRPQFHTQL